MIGGTDNNVEEYQTNENVQDDEMLAIEANENVQEEDVIGSESCILQNDIAKDFFDLMKDDVLYPGHIKIYIGFGIYICIFL